MILASTSYWQSLYKASKEGLVKLFYNETDLSYSQIQFLLCLKVYDICYNELDNKEYPFLDEELLKDPIRVKAFMYWRKQYLDKKLKEAKNPKSKERKGTNFKIYNGPRPDEKKESEQ